MTKRILAGAVLLGAAALTAERHPQIRSAQRLLNQAQLHLERAKHDYSGHRIRAIEHIRAAQAELQAALASDRR